jgi:FdhD protein
MSDSDRLPPGLTPTREVTVTRVGPAGATRTRDLAAAEEPLDVRLHGRSFAVIMRTPGEDRALAAGFLLSERIIRSAADIGAIEHCRHPDQTRAHHVVDVFLVGDAASRVPTLLEQRRQVIANSSCGVCGRATIEELAADIAPLASTRTMTLDAVRSLPDRLRGAQTRFNDTGGLHGAALFASDGTLLGSAEDVGRHNAVDKVIGAFLLEDDRINDGRPRLSGCSALMVSGRVSFEIVQKAWLGGIEILAAISAPTSLAIELADAAGITLIGFVRGSGLNLYTHTARVVGV